jgi:hypothetical protein
MPQKNDKSDLITFASAQDPLDSSGLFSYYIVFLDKFHQASSPT